jgi:uncharacterized LabA/DUF88 family protein
MLFVDGENFAIRALEVAQRRGITLIEGDYYKKDVFAWFPEFPATLNFTEVPSTPIQLQTHAIRAHYYTSLIGDDLALGSVRKTLRARGFHPEVFKKTKGQLKAKGVDISLSKDFLSHAFFNNYEVAVLISGDGDYVPLINEVKRLGKIVYVFSFSNSGLNPELELVSDRYFEMEPFFYDCWNAYSTKTSQLVQDDNNLAVSMPTPLSEEKQKEVETQYSRLNDEEGQALAKIMVVGKMTPQQMSEYLRNERGLPGAPDVLPSIARKTSFITGTFAGHFEINPDLKDVLSRFLELL